MMRQPQYRIYLRRDNAQIISLMSRPNHNDYYPIGHDPNLAITNSEGQDALFSRDNLFIVLIKNTFVVYFLSNTGIQSIQLRKANLSKIRNQTIKKYIQTQNRSTFLKENNCESRKF